MPPRSRVGSMARPRATSTVSLAEKDEKEPLTPSQMNDLLLSLVDHHHAAPIEVVEVASDMLLDRYVEFVSQSLVVRTYEGAKDAGLVTALVSAGPSVQVLHYADTDFFHVFENEVSRLLCVAISVPSNEFRALVEKTLACKIMELPQMISHVRMEYATIESVWALVRYREERDAKDQLVTDVDDAAVVGSAGKSYGAYAEDVLRDSTALSTNLLVMKGKNPAFYVDEFCLMFERHQPLATLQVSLDRAKEQLRDYDISSRLSHAEPLALCLGSLLNILTKPMHPSLCDDVCVVASTLAAKLIEENMSVACIPHAELHLSSFMHLLGTLRRRQPSAAMKAFLATFLSLTSAVKVIHALQSSRFHGGGEVARPLTCIAEVVHMLAVSVRESTQSLLPRESDLALSASRLQNFAAFAEESESARLRAAELASFAGVNGGSELPGFGPSADLGARSLAVSDEVVDAVRVLWPGAIACINVVIDTLDKLVCEGIGQQLEQPEEVDAAVQIGLQLVDELVHLSIAALRCLWFLPEADTARFLVLGTASVGSIFRRMSSWMAALHDEGRFWFPTVQCAISHVIAKALTLSNRKHLQFIHHQWIIRICVACGPSAERAVLTELHRFFCITKRFAGAYTAAVMRQVWNEVHQFALSVMATTPTPSNARAMWEAINAATEAYVSMSCDPFDPLPQRRLATIVYTSVLDIKAAAANADELVRSADEVLESNWDGYDDFVAEHPSEIRAAESTPIRSVSALEMAAMGGSLVYVLDLLELEKAERRWRSLGINCLNLADELSSAGAPHSIASIFVHAGVTALAKRADGTTDAGVLSLLCAQFESILYRWVNVRAAFAVLNAATAILASGPSQPRSRDAASFGVQHAGLLRADAFNALGSDDEGLSSASVELTPAGDKRPVRPQQKKPSVLDQLARDYFRQ